MAKVIEIQQPSWLERHPVEIRRLLVRLVFSLGTEHAWDIRVHGDRHRDGRSLNGRHHKTKHHVITDEEWAMLMGHR